MAPNSSEIKKLEILESVNLLQKEILKVKESVNETLENLCAEFSLDLNRISFKNIDELKQKQIDRFKFEIEHFKKDVKLEFDKIQALPIKRYYGSKYKSIENNLKKLSESLFAYFNQALNEKTTEFIKRINQKKNNFIEENKLKVFEADKLNEIKKISNNLQIQAFYKFPRKGIDRNFSSEKLEKLKLEFISKFEIELEKIKKDSKNFFYKKSQIIDKEFSSTNLQRNAIEPIDKLIIILSSSKIFRVCMEEKIKFNKEIARLAFLFSQELYPINSLEDQVLKSSNSSSTEIKNLLNAKKRKNQDNQLPENLLFARENGELNSSNLSPELVAAEANLDEDLLKLPPKKRFKFK